MNDSDFFYFIRAIGWIAVAVLALAGCGIAAEWLADLNGGF